MANPDLKLMILELRETQRLLAEQEIKAAHSEGQPVQPIRDRHVQEQFEFHRWAIRKLLATDPDEAERFSLDMCYTHFLIELRRLPAEQWVPFVQSVVAEHYTRMAYGDEHSSPDVK